MGQEIGRARFDAGDIAEFKRRVDDETALCARWWREGRFAGEGYVVGHELEGWLIDHNCYPWPGNQEFLKAAGSSMIVPELSRFNFELNGTPQELRDGAFGRFEAELRTIWHDCVEIAREQEGSPILIGILPTIRQEDLCLANISPSNRYRALNDRVLSLRGGRPIHVRIDGRETLELSHEDVMLEAATTSFQVHLQPPRDEFVRHFNAALVLSAPLVALAANSPLLFGRQLWEETRVPLFEQAVPISDIAPPERNRVTFGSGYLDGDPTDCFRENSRRFEMLLPMLNDDPPESLSHLRLQNGTIWRWNRPLVGFDAQGRPVLRIEQRVMPAGPSLIDMVANAAFFIGAAHALARRSTPMERWLPFDAARDNFYHAARDGLQAMLQWRGGQTSARDLILRELLPLADEGLERQGIGQAERDRYLDVVSVRVESGQTGSAWQRGHLRRHGGDTLKLVADYLERQRSGMPVHEWDW